MKTGRRFAIAGLAMLLVFAAGAVRSQAQARDSRHVVSLDDLSKDAAQPSQNRAADEASVRQLFSSGQAQKALKSAKIDYQRVDGAISQLSDEDLAQVASRARQAQTDFAAGHISGQGWIIILVCIAVLIIVLAIVF